MNIHSFLKKRKQKSYNTSCEKCYTVAFELEEIYIERDWYYDFTVHSNNEHGYYVSILVKYRPKIYLPSIVDDVYVVIEDYKIDEIFSEEKFINQSLIIEYY